MRRSSPGTIFDERPPQRRAARRRASRTPSQRRTRGRRSAALTACASRRSVGRRSATLSNPSNTCSATSAAPSSDRGANVAPTPNAPRRAPRRRQRRSALRRRRSDAASARTDPSVDDDVAGAVRNRETGESRAARAHVRADAHRDERDDRRCAERKRQDRIAHATRRCASPALHPARRRRPPSPIARRSTPSPSPSAERPRSACSRGARSLRRGRPARGIERAMTPIVGATNGELRALPPGDDDQRENERRDRERKQAMRPFPQRAAGHRGQEASAAERPIRAGEPGAVDARPAPEHRASSARRCRRPTPRRRSCFIAL